MLSAADNARYNDVEPGSILHDMARRYWLPYLRSEALEPNGPPKKIELLGKSSCPSGMDAGRSVFSKNNVRTGALRCRWAAPATTR